MKRYRISAIEHYIVQYEVEAESEEDAQEGVACGDFEPRSCDCILNQVQEIEEIKE